MSKLLEFNQVSLGYGRHTVLEDITFTLDEGDYLGLVGPNGAGKTTLLKAIIGSLKPSRGSVFFATNAEGGRLRLGYMPQHQSLDTSFPLTVYDTVMMGRFALMGMRVFPNGQDRDYVNQCLEKVGLGDLATRHISDLSGGQQQRVLMARALACNPQVLLLDEPTNGMDPAATQDTIDIVNNLHQQGMTVILVTHLLELVADNAEKAGILVSKEGHPSHIHLDSVKKVFTSQYLSNIFGRPVTFNHSCADSASKGA